MISVLSGSILSKKANSIVLDCMGIGFSVMIPTGIYSSIGSVGDRASVFIHMVVKEDAVELYGFMSEIERECFELLIGVSGVGPKSALSILSLYTPDKVALSIAAGDYSTFTACSGIGQKLAQRIVLELKDKVSTLGSAEADRIVSAGIEGSSAAQDAIAALVNLGFTNSQAASAIARLPKNMTVEQMLSAALKSMDAR